MRVSRRGCSTARTLVDGGAEIVNVGHKDNVAALLQHLAEQARAVERLVQVAVPGRVPACISGAVTWRDRTIRWRRQGSWAWARWTP